MNWTIPLPDGLGDLTGNEDVLRVDTRSCGGDASEGPSPTSCCGRCRLQHGSYTFVNVS
jgi:hypothetical protein